MLKKLQKSLTMPVKYVENWEQMKVIKLWHVFSLVMCLLFNTNKHAFNKAVVCF